MAKKNVEEMSAAELFALANKKQEQEKEKERAAAAKKIEDLKDQRKKVTAQYRKDLRAIDAKLQALGGGRKRRRSGGRGKITERILEIVTSSGPISTKEIRQQLEVDGIEAANLSQLLGTLKKTGRIVSPGRAMYAAAG